MKEVHDADDSGCLGEGEPDDTHVVEIDWKDAVFAFVRTIS